MLLTAGRADAAPPKITWRAWTPPVAAMRPPAEPAPARYAAEGGPRWPLLLGVVAAHAAGLALLALAVVHPAPRPRPAPLKVVLVPLEVAPAPPPRPAPTPDHPRPTPPPPMIEATPLVPAPAAPVLVAAPAPAPAPAAEPAAPAAAVAAPVAEPAPAALVPPDGFAATLHNPAPVYPVEARRRRQQGTVRLRVTISADGAVRDIAVSRTSGFDLLDRAALEAVRGWRFVPGSRGGVPVEAVGSLSIPFRLV